MQKIFLAHTLLKRLRLKTNYYTRGVTMKTTQGLGILTSLVFVSCASVSQAAVIDWSNVSGGDFNNGANWAGGSAPGAADTASFNTDVAGSYSASLSQDASVNDVSVINDDVVINLSGHNLDTARGITVGGAKAGKLVMRDGAFNKEQGYEGGLVSISVGSQVDTEGTFVIDNVDFGGYGMAGRMLFHIGHSRWTVGKGALQIKNGSDVLGQSAFVGSHSDVSITGGSTFSLANDFFLESGASLDVSEGSQFHMSYGSLDGEVLVSGEGSSLNFSEIAGIGGVLTFQNGATGSGADTAVGGNLIIDGVGTEYENWTYLMDIGGNATVTNGGLLKSADAISAIPGGVLLLDEGKVAAQRVMTEGGKIQGNGDITGNVQNTYEGTVATGANGSSLNIDGNYTQEHGSTLELALGDWDAIGDYKLNINGDADLDGILKIDLWDTFKPKLNDVFTLIKAENINGMFSDFVLPKLSPGLGWDWGSDMVAGMETFSLKVVKGVPEPYTIVLMTIGLAGFAGARRFRKAA
ncbi:PEP-CTERM sorting domain-containing protein [Hahella sp. NBU794]|uniref:PEP-CTERM sorting domain-containing protein n=1 Tax=Hahella sp. NBU794 TaxID=3422590 RepID=UPI003D6FDBAB